MQLESSTLKKVIRKVLPARLSGRPPLAHSASTSSQPIRGTDDTAMSAVEASLAALSVASALATKVPFISPVAGLLLQALTMRTEVKQHKEDWDVVMVKLEQVAGLVDNVGTLCGTYNLEEKDLPPGLREIFQSLKNELDGIKAVLKQSKEIGSIKQILLRKELQQKVKQYDGKLSNVVQRFQVTLALDTRFAQLADQKGNKVARGGPSGLSSPSDIVISMPRGPRSPQIFFGRDSELSEIIHMIFTHVNSSPARIAILGPGGYGKTTLANAVLTHQRVQEYFGDARYFVACESVFSSGALLIELAKTLGLLDTATDASWSSICSALNAKDCILCLDNFESSWDKDGDTRYAVEELLSRMAELRCATLLITMRGTVRPAQTQWTIPLLRPLATLDRDAARSVWEHTTNHYDAFAAELTKAVEYVPLAVSLLAHLAQATSAELLLKEWNEKRTKFIHTSQANKQSNLECSIQLSIDSGRMKANPSAKDMLGVLSMLPDGMHTKQMDKFQRILSNVDILSGLRTLRECSLVSVAGERYQTHPIIRNFCNHHALISQEQKDALGDFYIKLASARSSKAHAGIHAEMVSEVNNTKAILFDLLKSDLQNPAELTQAICTFIMFHSSIGDHSDNLIGLTVEVLQLKNASTSLIIKCLERWAMLHYNARRLDNAKHKIKEAEHICRTSQENRSPSHANILRMLGEICVLQDALNEAQIAFQEALEYHSLANDIIGQGNDYKGLGKIYFQLNKLQEAKTSYCKALEFHKLANDVLSQGNDYRRLGDIYFKLSDLNEAKVSYSKALNYHKHGNDALGQGNDYEGLGKIYLHLDKLQEADASYNKALKFHKLANDVLGQGNDYKGLGDIYFKSNKLDKALEIYQKALECFKHSNSVSSQGNVLQLLGRVQLARLQLQDAKTLFEGALAMHTHAQDLVGQDLDKKWLNEALLKLGKPVID